MVTFPTDPDLLRPAIREWLSEHVPEGLAELIDWRLRADLPGSVGSMQSDVELAEAEKHPLFREYEQACLDARLVCPSWPEQFGGRGWGAPEMTVLDQECFRMGVPRVDRVQGETMVGPSIILHGSDEQKEYYLPRILSGEDRYCQGFSEPGSGSDLASASTRGVVNGDTVRISGQKIWTSRFATANMIFVLCRTDQHASKHRGLSYIILPFTPGINGIETRSIRQMTGAEEFGEVFFDDARAPLSGVVGGLGEGWRVVQSTLGFERAAAGRASTMLIESRERELAELIELARANGRAADPVVRQGLAWAYAQVAVMKSSWARTTSEVAEGRDPGLQMTVWKLFWSEYHVRLGALAMEVLGRDALVRPQGEDYRVGRWQDVFLVAHSGPIYAGTSEVQRNIIGEGALGLPREPRPAPAG